MKDLFYKIIGKAFDVFHELNYGYTEHVYEAALQWELEQIGIKAERQVDLPVIYKGNRIKQTYRIDMLIDSKVIVENKSVSVLLPEHRAQLFNYMRITGIRYGILLNFGLHGVCAEKYYIGDDNVPVFAN